MWVWRTLDDGADLSTWTGALPTIARLPTITRRLSRLERGLSIIGAPKPNSGRRSVTDGVAPPKSNCVRNEGYEDCGYPSLRLRTLIDGSTDVASITRPGASHVLHVPRRVGSATAGSRHCIRAASASVPALRRNASSHFTSPLRLRAGQGEDLRDRGANRQSLTGTTTGGLRCPGLGSERADGTFCPRPAGAVSLSAHPAIARLRSDR